MVLGTTLSLTKNQKRLNMIKVALLWDLHAGILVDFLQHCISHNLMKLLLLQRHLEKKHSHLKNKLLEYLKT